MVATDQPGCFPGGVIAAVSSKEDGTMLDRTLGTHSSDVVRNRESFCAQVGLGYDSMVYQKIVYNDNQTYDVLVEVGASDVTQHTAEVHADALFTKECGVGLFLPVADCVATIMYDPVQKALALLHLGRHSTLTSLVAKTIEHFVAHGSDPKNVIVWMGPGAGREAYRLEWFDSADDPKWHGFYTRDSEGYYLDLAGFNRQQCIDAGVMPSNITISPVDTTIDPNYFSHMMGDVTGRIAVLAMMR